MAELAAIDEGLVLIEGRWFMRTAIKCERCGKQLGAVDVDRATMKLSPHPAVFRELEVKTFLQAAAGTHSC